MITVDSSLRAEAARALGSFKYPRAVEMLVGALSDGDKYVSWRER